MPFKYLLHTVIGHHWVSDFEEVTSKVSAYAMHCRIPTPEFTAPLVAVMVKWVHTRSVPSAAVATRPCETAKSNGWTQFYPNFRGTSTPTNAYLVHKFTNANAENHMQILCTYTEMNHHRTCYLNHFICNLTVQPLTNTRNTLQHLHNSNGTTVHTLNPYGLNSGTSSTVNELIPTATPRMCSLSPLQKNYNPENI